jgi:preprotein translocase subunit SecF
MNTPKNSSLTPAPSKGKMREFFKETNIDFAGLFPYAATFSSLVIMATFILIFTKGLEFGIDFRGGAEVQVKFQQAVSLTELRKTLSDKGNYSISVQSIGKEQDNEFLVKISTQDDLNKVSMHLQKILEDSFKAQGVEIQRTDIVGPKAGHELRTSAVKAMCYAILAIAIYVGLRFDFKYAPGGVLALIHDALIVVFFFAITGKEFSLQIVAAILAIIGYSINDTVVIYDRVREYEASQPGMPLKNIINKAINETMSRTILTAGATLIVCFGMLIFGGDVIRDFFWALTVGIISGTYSTIYVAIPLTSYFDSNKKVQAS